jgi:hypothetical protein
MTRNVVPDARVSHRELAAAAPAADKTGQQRVAMPRRSVMPARCHIVADHLADRLCPLPTDIAFMAAWDQGKPFLARPASETCSNG